MASEHSFAQFVSLACHDLRTPLATVSGFAHTLRATEGLEEPAARYLGMMQTAAEQMAELLDDLGLVARIEAGRYKPNLGAGDTLELVQAAAARLGEKATGAGTGAAVSVDRDAVERALAAFGLCALRHGALEGVALAAEGTTVWVGPVAPGVGPILLGEDLKDFGAVAARRLVEAIGGEAQVEGERLRVLLPR